MPTTTPTPHWHSARDAGFTCRDWRRMRRLAIESEPTCRHCQRAASTHVDHIVPRSAGGRSIASNLQALCRDCHARKAEGIEVEVRDAKRVDV